jgi:alpha-beta hydrolase superfamily lysophospholipase
MAAATRLAIRDLRRRLAPDRPLYIAGYSTGAALAVEYALARLQGEDLPAVEKLVLISPAIGVSPAAALAVWQGRISVWLGLPKVAWTDIGPEYDPYKYTSFPVNAADQVYGITRAISKRLTELGRNGPVAGVPKLIVFQSAVDATVSAPAVVDTLLQRLAPEGHEAVVFDLNRHADAADLFRPSALEVSGRLLQGPALPFALTVLANVSADSLALNAIHRAPVTGEVTRQPTALAWPDEIFSLSHVALPFPPDDPVYGAKRPAQEKMIFLGRPELLGERGLLSVSPATLLRLRHNPFYSYLYDRVERFLEARRRMPSH